MAEANWSLKMQWSVMMARTCALPRIPKVHEGRWRQSGLKVGWIHRFARLIVVLSGRRCNDAFLPNSAVSSVVCFSFQLLRRFFSGQGTRRSLSPKEFFSIARSTAPIRRQRSSGWRIVGGSTSTIEYNNCRTDRWPSTTPVLVAESAWLSVSTHHNNNYYSQTLICLFN